MFTRSPPFSLTVSTTIGRGAGCSSTLEAGYNKVSGIITNIRLSWLNPDRFLNASWNPIHGHTEIGTQIPSPSYLQSGIDLATQAVYLYGGITIILYKTKQFVKKPSVFLLSRRKWEEIDTSPVGLVHDLQVSVLNRTKSPWRCRRWNDVFNYRLVPLVRRVIRITTYSSNARSDLVWW